MQPTIVKTSSPADLLRLVPHLVGMQPAESLVLVAFRGKRTSGAMRFDLPNSADPARWRPFVTTAVGMLCRIEGVDGVLPVACTAQRIGGGRELPFRRLIDLVVDRADSAALRVIDALVVAGDGWGSAQERTLPPGGHPLAEILPPPVAAPALPPLEDIATLTRLPRVPPAARRRFAARVAAFDRTSDGRPPRGAAFGPAATAPRAERTVLDALFEGEDAGARIEALLDPGTRDAALPLIAAMAEEPPLRDIVLLQVGWGPEFGARARVRTLLDARPLGETDEAGLAFTGRWRVRPDPDRLQTAADAFLLAAAHLPAHHRAPLITMAAWCHWALGRGSVSDVLVDRALAVDPAHGLARILRAMLGHGTLPDWAFTGLEPQADADRWRPEDALPRGHAPTGD